jgi:hypothetical protein
MEELNYVTLEDGLDYAVIDEMDYNLQKYVYLANIESDEGFLIRKIKNENNKEYLIGLEDKSEFDNVLKAFQEKLFV